MLFYKTVEHCCQETINYSLFFRAPGRSCTACQNEFEKKWDHKNETFYNSSKLSKIKIHPSRFFFTLRKISNYLTQHTVSWGLLAKNDIFRRKLQTLLCQLLISNPSGMNLHAVVFPALDIFLKNLAQHTVLWGLNSAGKRCNFREGNCRLCFGNY